MKNSEPIIITETFNSSIDKVWNALTVLEQMHQWYFPNIPDFKPEVGFTTQFLIQNEGRNFTHIWTVKEVISQKLIGYSWNFKEYEGEGYSVFKLDEKHGKTQLTLENHTIKDFPTNIPEFKRESGVAGWKYLIKDSLVKFLAK